MTLELRLNSSDDINVTKKKFDLLKTAYLCASSGHDHALEQSLKKAAYITNRDSDEVIKLKFDFINVLPSPDKDTVIDCTIEGDRFFNNGNMDPARLAVHVDFLLRIIPFCTSEFISELLLHLKGFSAVPLKKKEINPRLKFSDKPDTSGPKNDMLILDGTNEQKLRLWKGMIESDSLRESVLKDAVKVVKVDSKDPLQILRYKLDLLKTMVFSALGDQKDQILKIAIEAAQIDSKDSKEVLKYKLDLWQCMIQHAYSDELIMKVLGDAIELAQKDPGNSAIMAQGNTLLLMLVVDNFLLLVTSESDLEKLKPTLKKAVMKAVAKSPHDSIVNELKKKYKEAFSGESFLDKAKNKAKKVFGKKPKGANVDAPVAPVVES